MKSPLKYSKWPIVLYFFSSLFIIVITLTSFYLSSGIIPLGGILGGLAGLILNTLVGWVVAIKLTGNLFYRKVKHSPEPYKLVPNVTYWLNGETPAVYVGLMVHTGKYLFHIEGYSRKKDSLDAVEISPDKVRKYISISRED